MEGFLEVIASGSGSARREVALPIHPPPTGQAAMQTSSRDAGPWFVVGPDPRCDLPLRVAGWDDQGIAFQWSWRHGSWLIKNLSNVPVMVDSHLLGFQETIPLLTWTSSIRVGDLYLIFRRAPQFPKLEGKEVANIPLTQDGLVIGRGDKGKLETKAPRLALDDKLLSISSNQAQIEKRGAAFYLINHNTNPTGRTILNGDQSFDEKKLNLGDCIEIPNCDFYTFKFLGNSLRHLGFGGKLRGQDMTVDVPGARILHTVNLNLGKGELLGIVGGSGQGKSTLMNALCGIVPATGGLVTVDGVPLRSPKDVAKVGIGYVPQDDIVHKDLIVQDALYYSARLRLQASKKEIMALLDAVLDVLRLTEHRHKRIHNLSGGQRKRVSIASELLTSPEYLFLDEPTSGLDPQTEKVLMGELSVLAKRKRIGVACTTHVLQNCHVMSNLAFISRGRLIFNGPPLDAVRFFLFSGAERPQENQVGYGSRSSRGTGESGDNSREFTEAYLLSNINRIYDIAQDPTKPIPEQNKVAENWEASYRAGISPDAEIVAAKEAQRIATIEPPPKTKSAGFLSSAWIMMARQWKILVSSKLNYIFLAAQALVIGFLIGWVDENPVLQSFLAVIATLWFGCSNGAQQIVGELAIFRRERLAGLGIHAYLWSKIAFIGAITVIQALALYGTLLVSSHYFHDEPELKPTDPDYELAEVDEVSGTVPGKQVREFRKAFFSNDLWSALAKGKDVPESMAANSVVTANTKEVANDDFFFVDAEGSMAPTALSQNAEQKRTVYVNPTGLRVTSMEYRLLEDVTFFFNLKENVLGALKVQKIETADPNFNPDTQPKLSWILHLANILGLRFLALVAAAMVGVGIGLTVSSLVNTPTQAVMWVPLILIPQILFGSFVVIIPEMNNSVLAFSRCLPSFNLQRIMDVAMIYGRQTPRMTNQTKIPAFLGSPPDDEEIVKWDGRQTNYDKITNVNKSWQNLVVMRERIGMREKVAIQTVPQAPLEIVNQVENREDVLLSKGVPYFQLAPAHTCGLVLLGWFGGCYLVSCISLYRRQTGR